MNIEEPYYTALNLQSQGLCCSEVAKKLNLPYRTVYDWLKGRNKPLRLKNRSKISDEQFIEIVKNSFSIRECLRKMNVRAVGGNYRVFKIRLERLKLSTSHFSGQAHLRGKTHNWAKEVSLQEAFVENGNLNTGNLKRKIIKYSLKEYKCSGENCQIKDEWLGKTISLHLDHINGNNRDNRLDNLRFLCPNCHSQTNTYCSKAKITPIA